MPNSHLLNYRRMAVLARALAPAALVAAGASMPAQAAEPSPDHPAVQRASLTLSAPISVSVTPSLPAGDAEAFPLRRKRQLNDTGITANQCYAAGSNTLVSCTSAEALALNDQQDGMLGRDVTKKNGRDGHLGFSFRLVPKAGGGSYDKTECVKDNVTGLTWEGKTARGARAGPNVYTNWGDGRPGDASAYAAYVNGTALCGFTNWRLPDRWELEGIVDYSIAHPGPLIDVAWFPNSIGYFYWSSSPFVSFADGVWSVSFYDGFVSFGDLNFSTFHVRLVR